MLLFLSWDYKLPHNRLKYHTDKEELWFVRFNQSLSTLDSTNSLRRLQQSEDRPSTSNDCSKHAQHCSPRGVSIHMTTVQCSCSSCGCYWVRRTDWRWLRLRRCTVQFCFLCEEMSTTNTKKNSQQNEPVSISILPGTSLPAQETVHRTLCKKDVKNHWVQTWRYLRMLTVGGKRFLSTFSPKCRRCFNTTMCYCFFKHETVQTHQYRSNRPLKASIRSMTVEVLFLTMGFQVSGWKSDIDKHNLVQGYKCISFRSK